MRFSWARCWGAIGAAVSFAAIWFAWRKTKGRPMVRAVAVMAAVAFALVTTSVVQEFNRELGRQAARAVLQGH